MSGVADQYLDDHASVPSGVGEYTTTTVDSIPVALSVCTSIWGCLGDWVLSAAPWSEAGMGCLGIGRFSGCAWYGRAAS